MMKVGEQFSLLRAQLRRKLNKEGIAMGLFGKIAKMASSAKNEPISFEVKISSHEVTPQEEMADRRRHAQETAERHNSINELRNIAFDVTEDGKITIDEALRIKNLFRSDELLRTDKATRPIYLQVRKLTKRSSPDEIDHDALLDSLERIIDPTWVTTGEVIDEIDGKAFCLTGDFSFGSKTQVQDYLVSLGGIAKSGVSRNVDYLIIGTKGSEEYAYGNYGSKTKRAIELQNDGFPIRIVHEREFEPLRQ